MTTEQSGPASAPGKSASKARGGVARAAKLSAEERSAIARDAAQQRWAERPTEVAGALPVALEGYSAVLDLGGKKLPCAVIRGPKGIQRVLSETGITNAILGGRSGASKRLKAAAEDGSTVPLFLASGNLKPFIPRELEEGPLVPIDYLDGDRIVRAYEASILPAICEVWLRARKAGELKPSQMNRVHAAELLLVALAQTGIVALIDEATGYEKIRPQNALQVYLDKIIRQKLAVWAKKFPDEFYENIYTLKGWKWPGMQKNRFSVVAQYTRDLVYERLGHGVLAELERKEPVRDNGQRSHKLHQWLTDDIGDPMLAQHLHALMVLQRLAIANGYGWNRFVHMVDQVLPKYGDTLALPMEMDAALPSGE